MKKISATQRTDRASVARNLFAVFRRRLPWAVLSGLLAVMAGAVAVLQVRPVYRATTILSLEDRTLPLDFNAAQLQPYAEGEVQDRSERVLAPEALAESVDAGVLDTRATDLAPVSIRSPELRNRLRIDAVRPKIRPPTAGDLSKVSVAFTLTFDDTDPATAEHVLRALQTRFLVDDRGDSESFPASSGTRLTASVAEVNRLAQTISELETEIETFERQNAAGLPQFSELNAQAMERADRERTQLDGQILALEERRMDLDRALRDIERDAVQDREGENISPLTSQRLITLQSERAMRVGLYGADSPETQQLSVAISELQRDATDRLDRATTELRIANENLARLERLYAIDHPDVVRLAHQVSALEARIDEVTLTGLTVGERRYVEGLASERRDIDGQIDQLRSRHESLRRSVADYESRALQGPVLEQQYGALKEELVKIRTDHENARTRKEALAFEQRIAEQAMPGYLTIAEPVRVSGPLLMSRPVIAAALSVVLGMMSVALFVLLIDRLDRRVSSAQRIAELQGVLPLAEIPFIHIPNQASMAPKLLPSTCGVVGLFGMLSVLVPTIAAPDALGRSMLGIMGL